MRLPLPFLSIIIYSICFNLAILDIIIVPAWVTSPVIGLYYLGLLLIIWPPSCLNNQPAHQSNRDSEFLCDLSKQHVLVIVHPYDLVANLEGLHLPRDSALCSPSCHQCLLWQPIWIMIWLRSWRPLFLLLLSLT